VLLERTADVVPRRLTREDEEVQPAEQLQREVPPRLVRQRRDPGVGGELTAQSRVER
jgi:hypothetical protein